MTQSAFPTPARSETRPVLGGGKGVYEQKTPASDGMSLRDYFAAQALAGHVSTYSNISGTSDADKVARVCYQLADAMMKARE